MKNYTVDSASAVYSATMKITETTDTNHADNINAGPKQLLENTIANRRDITALQNAQVQYAIDESDGGLNVTILDD